MLPCPFIFDALGNQLRGDAPPSVTEPIRQIEYLLDHHSLGGLHLDIIELPVLLSHPAMLHQLIAKGGASSTETPLLYDLGQPCFGSDRGLEALPRRLPIADVVHQLVHMVVEPLLSLLGTPHLDAVLDEPLHHKRRLILLAAQPVEHEHQQDIEFVLRRVPLDLLDSVTVFRGNLKTGNPLLRKLPGNAPALLSGKLPAPLLLHRDVVLLHLAFGGNPIEAIYPLPHVSPSPAMPSGCGDRHPSRCP